MLVVEASEQYVSDLERQFDATTNQLKPLAKITLEHALRVLSDSFYLEEVGDRLVKLSVQLLVRHLNFVLDKVNEKKALATERILYILEDLNAL